MTNYKDIVYFYANKDTIQNTIKVFCDTNNISPENHIVIYLQKQYLSTQTP